VVWGTAPTADEIRKLDQERMLKDTLFAEENTPEDLELARAMLAERSPEDIAAALARLYRARLPSPEDILDPGQGAGRSREDRGREKGAHPKRGEDRDYSPRPKAGKSSPRHAMAEGSVWFRAAIGSKKNAEARWLLPMICRRGGIDKHDIGAIRIMETTTDFEISGAAAESFAAMIKRPDKEDNIRIEALAEAPRGQGPSEKKSYPPRREAGVVDRGARHHEGPRHERASKPYAKPYAAKPHGDSGAGAPPKPRHQDKPDYAKPRYDKGSAAKPFNKKPKKKFRAPA
jgi:ATP-dependent RNA helicase DeaD